MSITVKVDGLPKLRRAIQRAPEVIDTRGQALVEAASAAVARRAQALAPVLTGRLRGSIAHEANGLSGGVFVGEPYWRHVEHGTRFMAAQPFMRPAAEAESTVMDARLQDVGQALERDWER